VHAQNDRAAQLLDIVKGKAGLVLFSKPSNPHLSEKMYRRYYDQEMKSMVTDSLMSQLIEASAKADTTPWKTSEFKRTIVISNRSESLNAKRILTEWKITDRVEWRKYRRLINKWTNTTEQEREVNYLSRPVITKDGNYGIIKTDIASGNLCCGGQIVLYKYQADKWVYVGVLYKWNY
jgi:hypothetical protein